MSMRQRILALVAGLGVLAAVVLVAVDPLSGRPASHAEVPDNGSPTGLARVVRRTLTAETLVDGTVRYAGSAVVVAGAAGALTWLPPVGRVIRPGRVVFRLAGQPVVLLDGGVPAYRDLGPDVTGSDVRQLNANLVELGYATSSLDPTSTVYSAATTAAVQRLQDALGVTQTGRLGAGDVVFLHGPVRITKLVAGLGSRTQPGGAVAQVSSTRREVLVDLKATDQSMVSVGDRVRITLPVGGTTSGRVTGIGSVADSGGESGATVPVHIAPRRLAGARSLDRATVNVAIVTARARRALAVPVTALLALSGGGYGVETVDSGRVHHLVRVAVGLFDDTRGLVEVTRGDLSEGQRIVVPVE
jgi:peptidoglycan hydrolase-like protein with peptidoglycan-binding domain